MRRGPAPPPYVRLYIDGYGQCIGCGEFFYLLTQDGVRDWYYLEPGWIVHHEKHDCLGSAVYCAINSAHNQPDNG